MSTPCENCGSDFRVCISCDLYNGKYIEIPDNATNQEEFIKVFGIDAWQQMIVFSGLADQFKEFWTSPYQKGGK